MGGLSLNGNRTIEVLIIEDDLRVAEIQKRFIEQLEGFQTVGIAASYIEAKSYIDILQPDLLLLDVYFPDMDGLALLKEAKQQHKQMGVIMITAAKEIDKVQEAISIGVFDYIIKPVVFERFKQALIRYRDFQCKLETFGKEYPHITQEQIDQLLQKEMTRLLTDKSQLPKGIDPLTLVKVLEVLKTASVGVTAEFVAQEMGVSRTTARRYLEHLVSGEKIDADLAYGTVGRPERVYLVKK